MSGRAWFSKLVILMFGFALVLIGDCLYNFPAGPINHLNGWDTDVLQHLFAIRVMILEYFILFSLCGFVIVSFASVCLAIDKRARKSSSREPDRKSILEEMLWYILIVSLVVGSVVFDWFIFNSKRALFFCNPSVVQWLDSQC